MTTTTKTTIAEQVADRFADGTEFWTTARVGEPVTDSDRPGEIQLDDLARHLGATVSQRDGWGTRYTFRDGSAIIDAGAAWDLALSSDCWCWAGAGHSEECTARVEE